MRTQEEIIARIREREAVDMFGFERDALMEFLTDENYLTFCKEGVTLAEVKAARDSGTRWPLTREGVIDCVRDYMGFAWEKAQDERGISASRSVSKMQAWLWIIGDDSGIDWEAYNAYGKPILAQICRRYDLPIPSGVSV